jgi:hypothetical protein
LEITKHWKWIAAGAVGVGILAYAYNADAADLNGSCCADLESRIADLEATAARKGNRKVTLNVTGWVAEQITYWDDGHESNTYVGGIGSTLGTHVKFTGQATISPGWNAGYVLHLEANTNDPLKWNQAGTGDGDGLNVQQSYWFLKSDDLGKLSVGKQSSASDNAALLVDGSGSVVAANWVLFDGANFALRSKDFPGDGYLFGAPTWGDIASCWGAGVAGDCNGAPINAVRYDTREVGGFSASASWGSDDFWDVALRYAGELGGFRLAATAAYAETSGLANDTTYWQAGAYVEHIASAIFVYGAYGHLEVDGTVDPVFNGPDLSPPDGETLYGKVGIRPKLFSIGRTVFYGEYLRSEDQMSASFLDGPIFGFDRTSSELEMYGLGVVQEIDAAAMSIWLKYRHIEGEYTRIDNVGPGLGDTVTSGLEPIQFIGMGALIKF